MTTEQRILALNVGARLTNTKKMIAQQLKNELDRNYSALTEGVNMNGISITPAQLEEKIGSDVFALLQQDANKLREFLKDF